MPYNGTGWTLPAAEGENWENEHLIKSNKPVIYDNEALPDITRTKKLSRKKE